MSHNEADPAASTDMFRAFVEDAETGHTDPSGRKGQAAQASQQKGNRSPVLVVVSLLVVAAVIGVALWQLL